MPIADKVAAAKKVSELLNTVIKEGIFTSNTELRLILHNRTASSRLRRSW